MLTNGRATLQRGIANSGIFLYAQGMASRAVRNAGNARYAVRRSERYTADIERVVCNSTRASVCTTRL
jgi:hypothetical protein